MQAKNKAFVGVSLDNPIFLTDWLNLAIKKLLKKHSNVMFLIADDLLRYTRTSSENGEELLDYLSVEKIISKRVLRFQKYLERTLLCFNKNEFARIEVKKWNEYEDLKYVELLRNLIIAYYNIRQFRNDVIEVAHLHLEKFTNSDRYNNLLESSAFYIIDEISMAIRIAEYEGYFNEYYPNDQVSVLDNIYNHKYNKYGLNIENLIKKKPIRKFRIINILNYQ